LEQKAEALKAQVIPSDISRNSQLLNYLQAGFFSLYNLGIRKIPIILNHKLTIHYV